MKLGVLKKGRKARRMRSKQVGDAPPWSVANPIRLAALTLLHDRELSPKEIADEIGESPIRVSEQLRLLYDAGCVEFVGRSNPKRGFARTVYRAVTRAHVSDEEYRLLPLEERDDLNGVALQWIVSELIASHRSGTMSEDEDLCLLSTEPNLDARGRRELSQRLQLTLEGSVDSEEGVSKTVQEIEAESINRMALSGEKGSTVVIALLAFNRERTRPSRSESQEEPFGTI